jgi:hypothetical protein
MLILGIELAKSQVKWTLLEGTVDAPVYLSHGKSNYDLSRQRPALLDELNKIFLELLVQHKPSKVAYRVSKNASSIEQIAYLHYPFGVLLLRCNELKIPTEEFNSSSFTHKRLRFPKGTPKYEACDSKIGSHAPGWDDQQRNSALSAWSALSV